MNLPKMVTVIGGGLSGLTSAILLNRAGFEVNLIEKKYYPFHRVCGEYISNEVVPFLNSLDISVEQFSPSAISSLAISSGSGDLFQTRLDLGGFGLSRYVFDNFLYEKAKAEGVNFVLGMKACETEFESNMFRTKLSDGSVLTSTHLISAHGKRSNLDRNRKFFAARSPYLGVKYHIRTDFPGNLIQLDNFEGGYCGTVKIEGDRYNLCYLTENRYLKRFGSVAELESNILFKNPHLKSRFKNSDFLNQKPEVINEISFEKKALVENHILYCGDAAGMISPLCGNGMAMAIHSAKILSQVLIENINSREKLETEYIIRWNQFFESRLRAGRLVQRLFGRKVLSEIAVKSLKIMPAVANYIIKRTHGDAF